MHDALSKVPVFTYKISPEFEEKAPAGGGPGRAVPSGVCAAPGAAPAVHGGGAGQPQQGKLLEGLLQAGGCGWAGRMVQGRWAESIPRSLCASS